MYLANCSLSLGSGPVKEGDVIVAAGANFGPWISLGKITQLSDLAVANILRAAMPTNGKDYDRIEGSELHPILIASDDGDDIPLAHLTIEAFDRSGLSEAAWNGLPSATRETLIWAEFQLSGEPVPALESSDAIDAPAPAEPPEGDHFLFDPSQGLLKYRGSVAGYWVTDLEGENVERVTKEIYGRLKAAAEAGNVAFITAAEAFGGDAAPEAYTEHDEAQQATTGGEAAQA